MQSVLQLQQEDGIKIPDLQIHPSFIVMSS